MTSLIYSFCTIKRKQKFRGSNNELFWKKGVLIVFPKSLKRLLMEFIFSNFRLKACHFTKNLPIHTHFWRILLRFKAVYFCFLKPLERLFCRAPFHGCFLQLCQSYHFQTMADNSPCPPIRRDLSLCEKFPYWELI